MKIDFPDAIEALRIYTDAHDGTNNHMLREDIRTSIMPIGGESSNFPDYSVEFTGDEDNKKNALSVLEELSEYKNYYHDDGTKLISDVISHIAGYLAWDGWTVYEILYNSQENKLRFSGFTTENLFKIFRWYIQIPKSRNHGGKKINYLKVKNIWKIEMPAILGGKKGFKKIIDDLKKFDSLVPEFYLKDINQSYDHQEYRELNFIFNTKTTLKWGWSLRDLDSDYKTEFYMFYQKLTFQWALAVLREHIIEELNKLLKRLEINSKIIVSGLPAPSEVLKFREELVKGKRTFDELLKFNSYL